VESPVEKYWKIKLEDVKEALDANNFEAFVAQDVDEAKRIVLDDIIPKTGAKTVSWGGSMTFIATGLYEALKAGKDMEVLDTFDKRFSPQESLERRRQSLLVDMYGNRVAGITFGPKTVIILVGRNKIVADLDDALFRVKQYAAPANAMRLGKNTPCVKTANCEECKSSDRICNTWTITEKAYPAGRIKVVLINEDLGL
jgi:hypothetical protein